MSTAWSLSLSLVLLVANAFFVAAEFALIAAKRHRLEADAGTSRAARAAVAGVRELSLMLAGAQLGITLCTLGLGALAKPAVADLLDPLLAATGLPAGVSYGVAFAISLVLVVFLHMVVGEMAPKSWAISHPERSARLLALPFRAFAHSVRWVLSGLNGATNALLRLMKVQPQDELAQAHRPDDLRMLVRQSAEHGLIPEGQQRLLTRMLQVQNTTVAQVMVPVDRTLSVPEDTGAREVERRSLESGRSRFPVTDARGRFVGLVHVRDAVRATAAGGEPPARELMGEPLTLRAAMPVAQAVTAMRAGRAQLALVAEDDRVVGIAALEDLLEELIGDFEDETDKPPHPS
ncbi:hemolysin family protein [Saccharothrix algeriensis]|uniref:CBS domain containing-hemolysin-like protein n=1 Tax=Saccharothrix algeriensis TaxID=173560 RepID=A0A8T8I363_9PSEU|nr:hemolysin family protein [Saccharothrix algeriensis]MBM7810278.1 CBS domain containing-hemolysin-like protein [Saccharothrix algeriensis]QTR04434.1 HlyC/CorC family transporter [Saccharothrix algeriensis]